MENRETEKPQFESDGQAEKGNPDKNKVRKKIGSAIGTALFAFLILFCLVTMAQVLSKGYASYAGYSMFRVVTGSMEPQIPVGSLLISKETDIEMLSEGDIICFCSKEQSMLGRIITHRIIGVTENETGDILLRTKGDANISEDGYYVTEDNLVGKVIWHTGDENIMTSIFSVLTNKIGFLSIIVIPVLLVASLILRENVKSIKKVLGEAVTELDRIESGSQHNGAPQATDETSAQTVSEDEYKEMYERIKAELMEEIEKGVTSKAASVENGEGETE